jgi:competence protein ComEC
MAIIHFLNVLEGDCSIIQHDSGRISVIDVSNAYDATDTDQEKRVKAVKENEVKKTNFVPSDKVDYGQKKLPDNPIDYINNQIKTKDIFRFIITHPDMDHLDGIKDFYSEFTVTNTWDTDNAKFLDLKNFPYKYNSEDWEFYTKIREGKYTNTKRLVYNAGDSNSFFNQDNIKVLSPSKELVKQANSQGGDIHDLSYVILFTVPKKGGGTWKFLFAGDSHDNSWDYILKNYKEEVSNIDVLFAPHHGRDSNRSYDFLKVLTPTVTLMGNASSEHLAYNSYKPTRITNNQAGYVIIDITEDKLTFYVKNKEFATNYKSKRNWGNPVLNNTFNAYGLFKLEVK